MSANPIRRYRLYGFTLATRLPLACALPAASSDDAIDLMVEGSLTDPLLGKDALPSQDPPAAHLYESPWRGHDGRPLCTLHHEDDDEVLSFPGVADFRLDTRSIEIRPFPGSHPRTVEIRLLGAVLVYWLERRRRPVLHASAVSVDGHAAIFLADNAGGKTALAAALVRQGSIRQGSIHQGNALLADDLVPLDGRNGIFRAHPGIARLRMWPDEADFFFARHDDLERVHPAESKRWVPCSRLGVFERAPRPISRLFLPSRRPASEIPGGGILTTEPLPPALAVLELVRGSFSPYLVEAMSLQPERLRTFAALVESVPVERLIYCNGFEHLDRVATELTTLINAPITRS